MTNSLIIVNRVALLSEDGTETELDKGCFTLKIEAEYAEGMQILFVDEAQEIFVIEDATYVEPSLDNPAGYWEVPFLGNGSYLPVLPKQ